MMKFQTFLILLLVLKDVISSSGPEIQDLMCSSTNIENYKCTWQIGPNDNISYYNVSYHDSYSAKTQACPKLLQDQESLTCQFHKDKGGSVHCQSIEVRATRSSTDWVSKEVQFCPRTDAQMKPPVNIKFPNITSTSIKITWKPPGDVIMYRHLLIYQLGYRKNSTRLWKKPPNLSETKENMFTLTSLEENTVYEIRIATKVEDTEWGPWSSVRTTTTTPGVPGIVSNMSAMFNPESNSLNLEWTSPSEPNGPIDYYVVRSQVRKQEWLYQNATNMMIEIPVDCNNLTDGTILTTDVAAVNKFGSETLMGEWAQRDYPVCEVDFITILPTVLQTFGQIKVVNILTAIIVSSLVVLIIIVVKIVIKRNSKLDLSGSPNINRRYKFQKVCQPMVEEEQFDELRACEETIGMDTMHRSSACSSCENVHNSGENVHPYATVGVACHTKLAVNLTAMYTSNQIPGRKNDLESKSTMEQKSPLLNDDVYVLATDVRCLPLHDNISNVDNLSEVNVQLSTDLEAHTCNCLTTGKRPKDNIELKLKTDNYVPHSAIIGKKVLVEKPPTFEMPMQADEETNDIYCGLANGNEYIPHNATILHS